MPSSLLIQLGLWALTLLVLVSAGFVVALRNLFRAALSLGLVLVGVAGLFVLLEAEFLAFVQILIYVGAILTLVVFAVMLTARVSNPAAAVEPRQRTAAALASAALFLLLVSVTRALAPLEKSSSLTGLAVSLPQLGQELITALILPFELISLVFVAAMVGAIAVAASRSPR